MQSIIYAALATAFLFVLFKLIDVHFPKKTLKEATLLRKHTEAYSVPTMDHAGGGHNVSVQRCLFTVQYTKNIQTESVDMEKYSKAVIGQKIQVVKHPALKDEASSVAYV